MEQLSPHFAAGDESVTVVPNLLPVTYTVERPPCVVVTVDSRIMSDEASSLSMYHRSQDPVRGSGCQQSALATVRLLGMLNHLAANPWLCALEDPDAKSGRDRSQVFLPSPEPGTVAVPRIDVYRETLVDPKGARVGYRFVYIVLDHARLNLNDGVARLVHENAVEKEKNDKLSKPRPPKPYQDYMNLYLQVLSLDEYVTNILAQHDRSFEPSANATAVPLRDGEANLYLLFGWARHFETLKHLKMNICAEQRIAYKYQVFIQPEQGIFQKPHAPPDVFNDSDSAASSPKPQARPLPKGRVVESDDDDSVDTPPPSPRRGGGQKRPRLLDEEGGPEPGIRDDEIHDEADDPHAKNSPCVQYRFPRGAQRIAPIFQHPLVMYSLRLYETATSMDWALDMDAISRRDCINAGVYRLRKGLPCTASAAPVKKTMLDEIKRLNAIDLKGLTPEERYAKRRSPEFMERFARTTMSNSDIAPSYKAINDWWILHCRRAQAEKKTWSAVRRHSTVDPSLCWFGNMVTRFFLALEETKNVAAVHEEIFLIYLARNAGYKHVADLKLHVIFSGTAQAGKSFAHGVLKSLCIPGTIVQVSGKSDKANTTEQDKDHMLEFLDELPSLYFASSARDNSDAMEKERLSSGVIHFEQAWIDENGKRILIMTTARQQVTLFGNTNKPTHMFSHAMQTRLVIHSFCAWKDREGHSMIDHLSNENGRAHEPDVMRLCDDFEVDACIVQMLCALVFELIYVGVMLPPSIDAALAYFSAYSDFLQAEGIPVDNRNVVRMTLAAETLTIMYAIHVCFFTPTLGWKPGRPFRLEDVLELQQFMCSTEAVAAFSFSILGDMFVHPQLDSVMKALGAGVCKLGVPGQHTTYRAVQDGPGNTYDFNYLCPRLAYSMKDSVYPVVASAIMHSMAAARGRLAEEVIWDILKGLEDKSMVVHNLHLVGTEDQANQSLTGADFEAAGGERHMQIIITQESPKAFFILRQFVQQCMNRNKSLIQTAIESAWHTNTPVQRYCMGQALRTGADFYPHLLHTLNVAPPQEPKEFFVANPNFRDKLMQQLFYEDYYDPNDEQYVRDARYARVDGDAENKFFQVYLRRIGVPKNEVYDQAYPSVLRRGPDVPGAVNYGYYPEDYIRIIRQQEGGKDIATAVSMDKICVDVKPLPHSDVVSEAERRILKLVARKLAKKPEKGEPPLVFNDGLVVLDAGQERMKQLARGDRARTAGEDARAR